MHPCGTLRQLPSTRTLLLHVALAAAAWGTSGSIALQAEPNEADWPAYFGGKERSLYSPLQQINRGNVSQLEVAWTYDTGDKGEYQANNLIVDGVLYTASPRGK